MSAPDQTTRRARHLAICEELAELGMDLARAAHREALRDMQPPPAPRTPIPGLGYDRAPNSPPRDSIFGALFALISRCVRQTMLLEDRLAAGIAHPIAEPAPRPCPPRQTPDQNHPRLHPDRLHHERLEDESAHQVFGPTSAALDHIRSTLAHAASAVPAPRQIAEPAHARRPIPVIPPGPEPPLTAAERSALVYLQTNPKPPDRARPRPPR